MIESKEYQSEICSYCKQELFPEAMSVEAYEEHYEGKCITHKNE